MDDETKTNNDLCPTCGAKIGKSNCCLRCGTMVNGIKVDNTYITQQIPVVEDKKKKTTICPNCKNIVVNSKTCLRCGCFVDDIDSETTVEDLISADQMINDEIRLYKRELFKYIAFIIISLFITSLIPTFGSLDLLLYLLLVDIIIIWYCFRKIRNARNNLTYLYISKIKNEKVKKTIFNFSLFGSIFNIFKKKK